MGFKKRSTYYDLQWSTRPLIKDKTGEDFFNQGGTATYEVSQFNQINKINDKVIDFKFRDKVMSYQGTLLFEFYVYLPAFLHSSNRRSKGTDEQESLMIEPNLCQFVLKRSINEFFNLSTHVNQKFLNEAPRLNKDVFRRRLRGD